MTDLPDFHIPHAEKIEWMVETHGFAIEPVAAQPDAIPPMGGYVYTIGFPQAFGFPEVAIFGLQPSAARGLFDLIADMLRGGTEIPINVVVVGLFDNDLRCVFAPIDAGTVQSMFGTAVRWHRGAVDVVQLLWPDRNGFLPYEVGFDQRLVLAQPLIAVLSSDFRA